LQRARSSTCREGPERRRLHSVPGDLQFVMRVFSPGLKQAMLRYLD
jgi:hypothetical protein